jgi:hypothetical protein
MTVSVASRSTWLLALAGLLFLGGCEPESGPGTVHPVEARIPHFDNPDHTITADGLPSSDVPAQLTAALDSAVWSVGVREGGGPELFGGISDVAVRPDGHLLILDDENREVRIFSAAGDHVASFGQKGEGPGEFEYPESLVQFDDGRIAVLGRMGRVQYFRPSGPTYEHAGGFTVSFAPEDACVLGNTLYLHGAWPSNPDHSIFAFSREGELLRALGPVYQTEEASVRMGLSRGRLACEQRTGLLVFGFSTSPVLYGLTPDGDLRWVTRISPFAPMRIEQGTRKGRTSMTYRYEQGVDHLLGIVDRPGPGVVAVRRHAVEWSEKTRRFRMHGYWLSSMDGAGAYIGTGTGHVRHVGEKRLYTQDGSFPKITAYDVTGVSWNTSGVSSK